MTNNADRILRLERWLNPNGYIRQKLAPTQVQELQSRLLALVQAIPEAASADVDERRNAIHVIAQTVDKMQSENPEAFSYEQFIQRVKSTVSHTNQKSSDAPSKHYPKRIRRHVPNTR